MWLWDVTGTHFKDKCFFQDGSELCAMVVCDDNELCCGEKICSNNLNPCSP